MTGWPVASLCQMAAVRARRSGGQGDGQPGIGEGGARGDAGLVDELGRPGGFGAVDPYDPGARASGEFVNGALADHPAAVDDRHGVAGALHLIQQVRGQHDGAALIGQAGDQRPHLAHARRVEPVHRLVQDEQFGVGEQARGDSQALPHAHRVRGDPVIGAARKAYPGQ
jgi:hypothetical protein